MDEAQEDQTQKLRPGDDCPFCGGRITVYDSKLVADERLRRFHCPKCRNPDTYGKMLVPSQYAPGRRRQIKRRPGI